MSEDFKRGFKEGYDMGFQEALVHAMGGRMTRYSDKLSPRSLDLMADIVERDVIKKPKRKVKQSPKQKLLTKMTKKKWDKYKKGKGKKTYVEIRGEVSRSQAFKKAAKRL